jgi:hypothetical protein
MSYDVRQLHLECIFDPESSQFSMFENMKMESKPSHLSKQLNPTVYVALKKQTQLMHSYAMMPKLNSKKRPDLLPLPSMCPAITASYQWA